MDDPDLCHLVLQEVLQALLEAASRRRLQALPVAQRLEVLIQRLGGGPLARVPGTGDVLARDILRKLHTFRRRAERRSCVLPEQAASMLKIKAAVRSRMGGCRK